MATRDVRSALLLRTSLEILRDHRVRMPKREVHAEVAERVSLTEAEQTPGRDSVPRWVTHLGYHTSVAASAGFVVKMDSHWSITEARPGRARAASLGRGAAGPHVEPLPGDPGRPEQRSDQRHERGLATIAEALGPRAAGRLDGVRGPGRPRRGDRGRDRRAAHQGGGPVHLPPGAHRRRRDAAARHGPPQPPGRGPPGPADRGGCRVLRHAGQPGPARARGDPAQRVRRTQATGRRAWAGPPSHCGPAGDVARRGLRLGTGGLLPPVDPEVDATELRRRSPARTSTLAIRSGSD